MLLQILEKWTQRNIKSFTFMIVHHVKDITKVTILLHVYFAWDSYQKITLNSCPLCSSVVDHRNVVAAYLPYSMVFFFSYGTVV